MNTKICAAVIALYFVGIAMTLMKLNDRIADLENGYCPLTISRP